MKEAKIMKQEEIRKSVRDKYGDIAKHRVHAASVQLDEKRRLMEGK